jgi:hypothetical protein
LISLKIERRPMRCKFIFAPVTFPLPIIKGKLFQLRIPDLIFLPFLLRNFFYELVVKTVLYPTKNAGFCTGRNAEYSSIRKKRGDGQAHFPEIGRSPVNPKLYVLSVTAPFHTPSPL